MTQIKLASTMAKIRDGKPECPFCNPEREPEDYPYKSYVGEDNDGGRLGDYLTTGACTAESDIYPPGDDIRRYQAAEPSWQLSYRSFVPNAPKPSRAHAAIISFTSQPTAPSTIRISAEAHHLIPGKQSMRGSDFEKWASAAVSGSRVHADVGYSVNNAVNGIWLPTNADFAGISGLALRWARKQGSSTPYLSEDEKMVAACVIMAQAGNRQAHIGGHFAKYSDGTFTSYAKEAKNRCNLVGQDVQKYTVYNELCDNECGGKKNPDHGDKHDPPYGIIEWMNLESKVMRYRIGGYGGHPTSWRDFVSKYAQTFHREYDDFQNRKGRFEGYPR